MTEQQQAAMRQALLAMQRIQTADNDCDFLNPRQADQLDEAITALRQALEQPAQQSCYCPSCEALGKELQRLRALVRAQQITIDKLEAQQEPVAWVDLLKAADAIVRNKVLWKRFIDGTPLANDIPCWMADFAQAHTRPQAREWVGLTGFEQKELMAMSARDAVFATEAKLKEKNA